MDEYIQKIIKTIGFNNLCKNFMNSPLNTKELEIDHKKYGIAVKAIQNHDLYKIPDYISITKLFNNAPKVGLANIGATCYMNATLQCLCQIEEFASFFKFHSHVKEVSEKYQKESKDCLTSSFKILIEEIWSPNKMNEDPNQRYYEPNEFRQKIARMNPLFEKVEANDAKDLVNFIIMTLHEELNEPLQNNNNNMFLINQQDPKEIFRFFMEDYKNNFRSKISEIFYAIQQTQTKCLTCNNILFNYQAYFFLVFPLEEVKKYAINKIILQNNFENNNIIDNNMNFFGMNNINININSPMINYGIIIIYLIKNIKS